MKNLKILFILLFVFGCKTKYDISKAVEILPSNNAQEVDYTLYSKPVVIDDAKTVVNLEEKNFEIASSFNFSVLQAHHNNGFVYGLGKNYISVVDLSQKTQEKVLHDIQNPKGFFVSQSFVLVYNSQKFVIFDAITLEMLFDGNLKIDELASKFACVEDVKSCFAISASGEIVEVNLMERYVKNIPAFQKQETILNKLYKPAVLQNYIIFISSNTEFSIFDIATRKVLTNAPFVDGDTSSIFDINLVKSIDFDEKNVVISYTNGLYAFNLLYGKPLWNKKIITSGKISFFGDYVMFYDRDAKKITAIHVESGGVKWEKEFKNPPIAMFADYEKNMLIFAKDGIHLLEMETGLDVDGEKSKFANYKFNASNVIYAFSHNDVLYYVDGNKIFAGK